ncbi:hypothetical protein chiPu_0011280 [Chiloscyllium punctatum]|uniref:Uncharacterized protein n=1 Tax=Chiloscyllium punctatum TaxID=137246 RepID=A0A401SR19_CHIPU|nr:hypothetical protein [Chiloscyllium punctatum]
MPALTPDWSIRPLPNLDIFNIGVSVLIFLTKSVGRRGHGLRHTPRGNPASCYGQSPVSGSPLVDVLNVQAKGKAVGPAVKRKESSFLVTL